jgi:hypothetical protein
MGRRIMLLARAWLAATTAAHAQIDGVVVGPKYPQNQGY